MLKFRKLFSPKIISLVISIQFLCIAILIPYAYSISKHSLRVPLNKGAYDRIEEVIRTYEEQERRIDPNFARAHSEGRVALLHKVRPDVIEIVYKFLRENGIEEAIPLFEELQEHAAVEVEGWDKGGLWLVEPKEGEDLPFEHASDSGGIHLVNFPDADLSGAYAHAIAAYVGLPHDEMAKFFSDAFVKWREGEKNPLDEALKAKFLEMLHLRERDSLLLTHLSEQEEKGIYQRDYTLPSDTVEGGIEEKRGLVQVFKGGVLIASYPRTIPAKIFSQLDGVTIKEFTLNESGGLRIGRRKPWATFKSYPNAEVEIDVKEGLVTVARILDEAGQVVKPARFSLIYDRDGRLVDVFYRGLSSKKFSQLDGVTIKEFTLDKEGKLTIGARTWASFTLYPNAEVEIDVKEGLVTEVRILDEAGQVVEPAKFSLIYDRDGRLVDVFYGGLLSEKFSQLDGVTIKHPLDKQGNLKVGGGGGEDHTFTSYPNAEVEIDIEEGEITWVQIVKDQHGNPVDYKRIGDGVGRESRFLHTYEIRYKQWIVEELIKTGLERNYSELIADPLVRMKQGSLERLVEQGLLTQQDKEAIINLSEFEVEEFANKIKENLSLYKQNDLTDEQIEVFLANIIPWDMVEMMMKRYGVTLKFIVVNSMHYADSELWIRRYLTEREKAGRLLARNLKLYDPEKVELRNVKDVISLLEREADTLERLITYYQRKPAVSLSYSALQVSDHNYILTIASGDRERMPRELRIGDRITVVNGAGQEVAVLQIQGFSEPSQVIATVVEQTREVPIPDEGQITKAESVVPYQVQLQVVRNLLGNLRRSGRTTGLQLIDALLGLSKDATPTDVDSLPEIDPDVKDHFEELYSDQSQLMAARLALNGERRLALIQGPPGSGKTEVIAEIARQLVAQGKRVLVTSQMNQAVDNAVAKLMDNEEVPVLRVGNNPDAFSYGTERVWIQSGEAVDVFTSRLRGDRGFVIGGTNIGIQTDRVMRTPNYRNLEFDVVIIDEASKDNLLGTQVPLSRAKRAIIVGDHKQLPPFGIDDTTAKEAGLSSEQFEEFNQSLLGSLIDQGLGDQVMLSTSWRAHPILVGLFSELFYDGEINKRGWEDLEEDTLRVIDTSSLENATSYRDKKINDSYQNVGEAELVVEQVIHMLSLRDETSGEFRYQPEGITIITPYLPQTELIGRLLWQGLMSRRMERSLKREDIQALVNNINTIDSFQGGENKVVILSFVRSNDPFYIIGFLKDMRRLNVSISRAIEKMTIIGDFTTLTHATRSKNDRMASDIFFKMMQYYEEEVVAYLELLQEPVATATSPSGDVEAGGVAMVEFPDVDSEIAFVLKNAQQFARLHHRAPTKGELEDIMQRTREGEVFRRVADQVFDGEVLKPEYVKLIHLGVRVSDEIQEHYKTFRATVSGI